LQGLQRDGILIPLCGGKGKGRRKVSGVIRQVLIGVARYVLLLVAGQVVVVHGVVARQGLLCGGCARNRRLLVGYNFRLNQLAPERAMRN